MPLPAVANVIVPGFALASAMYSCSVLTGTDGLTTSTCGLPATSATGARSFSVSNWILPLYSVGFAAKLLVCMSSV